MVVLDATAGNRMMWGCKEPPLTVFMDKESGLRRPPDIVAAWKALPFRDDVFETTIFDPPHAWAWSKTSLHSDPKASKGSWWGNPPTRLAMVRDIAGGLKEIARVSKRLCLKWNDSGMSLWRILSCFRGWKEIYRRSFKSRAGWDRKSTTWWVTFVRSPVSLGGE